jgi:phenylalanyl-tRNA synthetase beta chain
MKFSVNWLREFVDLPEKIHDLAELLTLAGVEIEAIEELGSKIDKVIVAQIAASSQHPNANRLTVCEVDDGSGAKRQIVCGATNYKVGDKVPLALPGALLPNGLQIRASKLRGVDSEGMLCSGNELGLSEDAAGLLILSPEAKVGAPIADVFPGDTILDVEITPNRGDLLSHFGLAREIAALTNKKIVEQPRKLSRLPNRDSAGGAPAPQRDGVKISALRECPFYSARKIDNVKVGPSPDWLRAKLEAVGIRSINNIVDITNFVMLEIGQPLHAFDADKLKGGINVRLAFDGEKFLALDGKTYSLAPENLLIADDGRAVAIAGVMGGEDTGVTESTTNVLLESAYFLPASVRRTARTLNLPSDSSYRFERGVDPGMILAASDRAAELIREIAGGVPAKDVAFAGEVPPNPSDVSLSYEKCNQVLGLGIEPKTIDQILERFGLSKRTRLCSATARQASKSKSKEQSWNIPSYRRDLQRDVDLIEEVVRPYGVEKIPGTDRSRFTPSSAADRSHDLESILREELVAHGLAEVRTSKLIPRAAAPRSATVATTGFGESAIALRNPLSEDHVALRPSLISGLLAVLERNIRAGAERVAIFELGRVFVPSDGNEERRLGILLSGNLATAPIWRSDRKVGDSWLGFFDAKGIIESLGIPELSFRRIEHEKLPLAVGLFSDAVMIGFLGQRPSTKIAPGVFIAELNLGVLLAKEQQTKKFRKIERFPAITRDIAMFVPEEISHEDVVKTIKNPIEPLLDSVEVFDCYPGTKGSEERTSLAYRLTYRDRSRTLTSEEVTAAHAKIRERLQRELGAELRE